MSSREAEFGYVILTSSGFLTGAWNSKTYVVHHIEEAMRFALAGARDMNKLLYTKTRRPSQVLPYPKEP